MLCYTLMFLWKLYFSFFRMFSGWRVDQSLPSIRRRVSVLSCFPPAVGRDVVIAMIKPLAAGLGNPGTRSFLRTDKQVNWTMEVMSYCLTLPLDGDTVKLCVDIYTDWLTVLIATKDSIPPPISREPNIYIQKILRHLYTLFLPRSDQDSPLYIGLCQQVLCAVQSLATEGAMMNKDTWVMLLHFLLHINHAMLAPPTVPGGVAGKMADRSMAVLFEVWLLACARCFPAPSDWKTARDMLVSWRHQAAVVDQWSRTVSALTSRLLLLTFGPSFPTFKVPDEDAALVPADMNTQRVSQTWIRVLHVLSNPVDLRSSLAGGLSSPLQQEASGGGGSQMPQIFYKAMRTVSKLVDAFLGVSVNDGETAGEPLPSPGVAVTMSPFRDRLPSYGFARPRSDSAPPFPVTRLSMPSGLSSINSTPPHSRRQRETNTAKATSKPSMAPPSSTSSCRSLPSPRRSKVNSILHLFGNWLFDAALVNMRVRRSSFNTVQSLQCDVTDFSERWLIGRAEACGTLCRIFTSKKTAEDILPVYLSRFFMVLLQGLQVSEELSPPVLSSIVLNSSCLFCCDLKGVNLLLPSFISALENVLPDKELLRYKNFVNPVELRRASISILLSLLPLPHHFGSVQSEVLLQGRFNSNDATTVNILSLKPRLLNVLFGALQTETDSTNTQMLLAAMLNVALDSAMLEASEQTQQETDSQHGGSRGSRGSRGPSSRTKLSSPDTVQSEAAGLLWVRILRLLTQRLTAQWWNNSAVCLSTLELLGGLAKVQVSVEESDRRRAVSSVCTYIVFQCSRPPPLHSRDLHSIIVAAFHCLNVWITQHPSLLDHQECLVEVLEIVELGISGSKSRQEQEVRYKAQKELSPASMRVKDAADVTLSCIMQVLEAAPPLCGSACLHSPYEDALIGCSCLSDSRQRTFRYFVLDNSVILAMLENPLDEQQGQKPDPREPHINQIHMNPT
ncbi:hypothetical protein LDENG_00238590 [Lucifuga dentata]|nr:hypothetical protein LDENG_00238590 [Lucifuga dentata]